MVAKPHPHDSHSEEDDLTDVGIFPTLFRASMHARRTSPTILLSGLVALRDGIGPHRVKTQARGRV
jgi:hypothetical protein